MHSVERSDPDLTCFVRLSIIMTPILASLPLNGAGSSFLNGGGPGSVGLLSNSDDMFKWICGQLVPVLFQDAVCGDGICQEPEEQPGVGRFGCTADCGSFPANQKLTINVDVRALILPFRLLGCKAARPHLTYFLIT